MGVVKKLLAITAVALLFVSCTRNSSSGENSNGAAAPSHVLIVIVDACRADYLRDVNLPNIQQLAQRGVSYTHAMSGMVVSDTPGAHVTMGTGSFPARHGLPDFDFRSAQGAVISPFTFEASHTSQVADLAAASGAPLLASQVRQKLTGPIITVSGTKHYAAVGFAAGQADYVVFLNRYELVSPGGRILCSPDDPCFVDSPPGKQLPADLLAQLKADPDIYHTADIDMDSDDTFAGAVAARLVREYRPALLMVNLPATDSRGHWAGGPLHRDKMAYTLLNADQQIGRILDAYREAGLLDQTLVIVAGDHGMVPNVHAVDPAAITALINQQGAQVVVPTDGNAYRPVLWIDPPEKAAVVANAIARANLDGILGVYYRQTVAGETRYVGAPGTTAAGDAQLDAVYAWLLATTACVQGPDVVLVTRENTMIAPFDYTQTMATGHSELTWGAQHVPLIIAGPGVAAGVSRDTPAMLADFAPTIAAALHLPFDQYEGLPLVDAFSDQADPADAARLAARTASLSAIQDRLIAQCEADGSQWCQP
jgi:hypothetical protein